MVIDITAGIAAHLRRLVLAGLPLLAPACDQGPQFISTTDGGGIDPTCLPRTLVNREQGPGAGLTASIGFERTDPRWSDLYAACTGESMLCDRLCSTILGMARPMNYYGGGFSRCDLGCDSAGGAVVTINYSTASPGRRPEGFEATVVPRHQPGGLLDGLRGAGGRIGQRLRRAGG
jgi:hypothetical protein